MKYKKIAIIHDHILHIGGAEKILFALVKLLPQADIYTAFAQKDLLEKYLPNKIVKVSFFNKIPFSKQYSNWFKPFLYSYWEQLDLNSYDLVISSSHSYSSKSVISQAYHISYIHTPPRYLYNELNETQMINVQPFKTLLSPLLSWLRQQDYVGAQRPDILIANSKNVQQRIWKYYRRESGVIYPPVKVPKFIHSESKKKYFICVSRLVKQKGIDLIICVCNKLQLRLVVVGEGTEKKHLQSLAGPTVEFKNFLSDKEISILYSKAKALIYCSIDEDFGMVPVEAMAHGVPVIAFNSGGVKETVIHKKTGILFNEYTEASLIAAINEFKESHFSPNEIGKQAEKFSEVHFLKELKLLVSRRNF